MEPLWPPERPKTPQGNFCALRSLTASKKTRAALRRPPGRPQRPPEALQELFLSLRSTIFARFSIKCFLSFATSGGFVLSSGVFVFALLSSPLALRIVVSSSGTFAFSSRALVFSFGPSSGVFVSSSGVFVFSSWAHGLQLWALGLQLIGLRR